MRHYIISSCRRVDCMLLWLVRPLMVVCVVVCVAGAACARPGRELHECVQRGRGHRRQGRIRQAVGRRLHTPQHLRRTSTHTHRGFCFSSCVSWPWIWSPPRGPASQLPLALCPLADVLCQESSVPPLLRPIASVHLGLDATRSHVVSLLVRPCLLY